MAFLRVSDRERDRLAGIEKALAAKGMKLAQDRVFFAGGSGLQDGRNAMRAVLQQHPQTTAVICANDLLAAGAIMECRAKGIAVPQQMSITGYSDLEFASAMEPGITTVRTPSERLGLMAAQWLVRKLAGEEVFERCELETELIIRGSTGPATQHTKRSTPRIPDESH
jgi:LacI family transcriptional regulator